MQELWKLNIGWDESVSPTFYNTWSDYYNLLLTLSYIRIPRGFNMDNNNQSIIIHGFGDASEKAYGACIYCVYKTKIREHKSHLICSKSKVTPLKIISLPKLE